MIQVQLRRALIGFVLGGFAVCAGAQDPKEFLPRPFPMGASISTFSAGQSAIFAGTAGLRVYALRKPSLKFILSNAHVIGAVSPSLCPGTAVPLQTLVLQPGTLDIGANPVNPRPYLAGIEVAAVPIDFSPGASNIVDAAVALTSDALASSEIRGLGQPTPALAVALPGMQVAKSGRTTGVTFGSISSINATVLVSYQCGVARFVGQVITSRGLGGPGDSGSALLDVATNAPVGLFFAGSSDYGVANQMLFVYLTIGVFVDSAPTTPMDTAALLANAPQVSPRIKALAKIQARNQAALFAKRGIVGMGIGRATHGQNYHFVLYSTKPAVQMAREVPGQIEGVPVRIVETGVFQAY